jgi:hypothetical protein
MKNLILSTLLVIGMIACTSETGGECCETPNCDSTTIEVDSTAVLDSVGVDSIVTDSVE